MMYRYSVLNVYNRIYRSVFRYQMVEDRVREGTDEPGAATFVLITSHANNLVRGKYLKRAIPHRPVIYLSD